ncbi:MAG: dihydroorotase [Pseudohongiellaceae bacterium]
MQEITITRPDDWHVHLRDGPALTTTVSHTARYFGRAIIMPNLLPPVVTTRDALQYRERVMQHCQDYPHFEPLMVLYLTDNTSPDEIARARDSGLVHAVKLYPAGATTNSSHGVTNLQHVYPCLERMSELGLPLLIHGEVTDRNIDIFDREQVFIERILAPLRESFPALKTVLEHITTKQAVDFVNAGSATLAATVTVQHLKYNRNHMLAGGIKPHYYCLPVLKRDIHQQALLKAVASGSPKFFLGTDSAPHAVDAKENACGCAGCYTAHGAIELYAEIFEGLDALDRLEGFASFHGPDFYGLPRNRDTLTLRRQSWKVPDTYPFGEQQVAPLGAGTDMKWSVISE